MLDRFLSRLRTRYEDERTSTALRERFRQAGVDVGLYSYGCFDLKRFQTCTTIGRYCSFAETSRVYTRDRSVDFMALTPYLFNSALGMVDEDRIEQKRIVIEDDVWFGHNAVILPGAKTIGRGAVVGAGAVVTKPVEPYAIVVGNPARVLKKRFDDATIARIEATRWWELDLAGLRRLATEQPELVFNPAKQFVA